MKQNILILFTRTPLHVGAGSSVGAIDQPIQRERHTAFPIIPGSSIKGVFADAWKDELVREEKGKLIRPGKEDSSKEISWLFGSDKADAPCSGALRFSEARLLAFPIRSAKGGFAWITCPLALARAQRDGVIQYDDCVAEPEDGQAYFNANRLGLEDRVAVLEEYAFRHAGEVPASLVASLKGLFNDVVWNEADERIVIVSNGMMSYFAQSACEVAQHVRIDPDKGTVAKGALFNQENVPADTLFYSVVHSTESAEWKRSSADASAALERKVAAKQQLFQFGGDSSTGLGYCTVVIR